MALSAGLLAGTAAAAATHGLTLAEGKGGWLGGVLHTFPSTMAQNFWIAIFAWSTCFLVTVLVSLMSVPKAESELHNLVYGLTNIPHEQVRWYKRPAVLAVIVIAALVLLNLLFW